uniref:histidine kinase n=1 Tax=Candidatus Kentrum sp. DK TaxID=2126562 RepID=A0A450SKQ1_9GAMM|nr:MAG: Histidine kinase-, DNA gyrase B-, and HSP90-like ATPase [Candidatus Kentron sp. DK]
MAGFRTSARTVDMLGRQQIAGIPTAINELFKNAHDAYADRVEVDYYRSDKLFVLRDDGIGMTEEEFLQRWLTLGTESKLGVGGGLVLPYRPPEKPERPLSGEKGIGRLSIAVLGPQVLVLSRAQRADGLHALVAAYLHWGIFELPGLHLEDIAIPVRTFPAGSFPGKIDIRAMTEEFATNLRGREGKGGREKEILADLDAFDLDPVEVADYLPRGPDLRQDGTGTWFLISPTSELLERDIDGADYEKDRATPIEKSLQGFAQTMTPGHPPPVLKTAFRDHAKSDLHFDDLISEDTFFTPAEMENADHRIQGEFDEYGQFRGTISVYGEEHPDHIVNWREGAGKPTRCGPFQIHMATIQGEAKSTTLPLDEYARMVAKLNRMGSLYIYRDGIRMLPYGDTDFDWLDIEYRRTKKASYYYWSYRRIFGVVSITRTDNDELQEKAGREGFRENLAYRQLRSILKNFFIQVAADFFREDSPHPRFDEKQKELERLDKARKRREKWVTTKRAKLKTDLERFFQDYDDGQPEQEGSALVDRIGERLEAVSALDDPEAAAAKLLDLETEARWELKELREKYALIRPRGIALGTKKLEREWGNYQQDRKALEEKVFQPVAELIEGEISARAKQVAAHLDRRRRIQRVMEELEKDARKVTRKEKKDTDEQASQLTGEVRQAARGSLVKMEEVLRRTWDRFTREELDGLSEEEAVAFRLALEKEIETAKKGEADYLQYIRAQLDRVNLDPASFGSLDELEAMEQKASALEERIDMDLDLTQLGMALGIIEHEFHGHTRILRDSVRDLKAWADLNDGLKGLYQDFRNSFEHLDGYLTLFQPLNRRLRRNKVPVHGNAIETFLGKLFGERCRRHQVSIEATRAFQKKTVTTFPSSILPVFVNLADNALFWLGERPAPRIIKLDADERGYLFSDNGRGIPARDREAVFEQFFTQKPGGRGLGLFISREVLRGIGFTLELLDRPGAGATFRIGPEETDETEAK